MPLRMSPEGELIFVLPAPSGTDEGNIEDTIDKYLAENSEESADSIATSGGSSVSGSTTRDITGEQTSESDEFITQRTRTFLDVPTPEQFLDNFSNALSGFAQQAGAAGLSGGDLNALLDPASGMMQTLLQEYMGNLAERAAKGEDLFEVVGAEGGGEEFIGSRLGRGTEQTFERVTRIQAEEILKERGETVTAENITRVIDEETQARSEAIARSQDTTTTTKEDKTTTQKGDSTFEETEDLFRRPQLAPVFKFSPTNFLTGRFDAEEMDERAIGRLATEIRASAPRNRPRGGTPTAVSARRA